MTSLKDFSLSEVRAAYHFVARQDRTENPCGKFDKAGRWYPAGRDAACALNVRAPSRAYPYSYLLHCRSAKHVAHMYCVDAKRVTQCARVLRAMRNAA